MEKKRKMDFFKGYGKKDEEDKKSEEKETYIKSEVAKRPEGERRKFLEQMARANGVPVHASESDRRIIRHIARAVGMGGIQAFAKYLK